MTDHLTLHIGTIALRITLPDAKWERLIRSRYRHFLAGPVSSPSAHVTVHDLSTLSRCALAVERRNDGWVIRDENAYSRSSLSFRETSLYCMRNRYAFDSWLRIFFSLLGLRHDLLLIHGAATWHEGKCYLFAGRSGRGKSTITRILGRDKALSDELTLVTRSPDGYRAASTPFWGELQRGTGKLYHDRLAGIFFIEHGERAAKTRICVADAVKRLLTTTLFFERSPRSLDDILGQAHQLTTAVPSYVLTFAKDSSRREILGAL